MPPQTDSAAPISSTDASKDIKNKLVTNPELASNSQADHRQVAKVRSQHLAATATKDLPTMAFGQADGSEISMNSQGKVVEFKDKDGKEWTSKDGKTFSQVGNESEKRRLVTGPDHNSRLEALPAPGSQKTDTTEHPSGGSRAPEHSSDSGKPAAKPAAKPVDAEQLKKNAETEAEAIHHATGDGEWYKHADRDAINLMLENKSDDERKAIGEAYQKKYGISLEKEVGKFESGAEYDKFSNILNKKDGDMADQNAARVHQDLLEHHNMIQGRSNTQIEKDIRDTLSTQNPDQIKKMEADYKQKYGVDLQDAIQKDGDLSPATKGAADIYFKRAEGSIDPDAATNKLVDMALQNKNVTMFNEAMRDASPSVRQQFMNNDGLQRLSTTFDGNDLQHALDYAREGKLSAATQIHDQTGLTHTTTDQKGIEQTINNMSEEERKRYEDGKSMVNGKEVPGLSVEDQHKAIDYYMNLHHALESASSDWGGVTQNSTELQKWEDMIAHKDGTIVSNMAGHQGIFHNDSAEKIGQDIDKMSAAQWEDGNNHPERREELKQMFQKLGKSPEEVNKLLAAYDKKLAEPKPNEDLMTKLQADTNEQALSDLQAAARSGEVAKLLKDPTSAQEFKKAVSESLSDDDYQKYGKSLVETGRFPMEDKLHAEISGLGGSKSIVADLKSMTPQELKRTQEEYANKYGSSLDGDLLNKLTGQDKAEAERVFTQNLTTEERANIARDQTEVARSGLGSSLTDEFSASGGQADDAREQTNKALSQLNAERAADANGNSAESHEQRKQLLEKLAQATERQNDATDNHVEAKGTVANYASDAIIAGAAVAVEIGTAGAATPLTIAGLAAFGAGAKVGINAAVEGQNYDWSAGNVAKDATVGAVTAGFAAAAPEVLDGVLAKGGFVTAGEEATGLAAVGMEAGAGAIGGGAGGLVQGVSEIDSTQSFGSNVRTVLGETVKGAAAGAVGGAIGGGIAEGINAINRAVEGTELATLGLETEAGEDGDQMSRQFEDAANNVATTTATLGGEAAAASVMEKTVSRVVSGGKSALEAGAADQAADEAGDQSADPSTDPAAGNPTAVAA